MINSRNDALKSFQRARQQAKRASVTAKLTGRDDRQLPFEVVRDELRLDNPLYKGVQQIPLNGIVGSIGRYEDFTRTFLPLKDMIKERWVGVEVLATQRGWPPIDVFQVGTIYFIKDGNHRTAVARQMGNNTIEAHVWAYPDDIKIDPAADLDDILIKIGEEAFMRRTHLDEFVPDHGILFTSPGRYPELDTQIEDWRRTMARIDGREIPFEDAVTLWYDMKYLPVIQIIRESDLLGTFDGRTESDLFVWLSMHRDKLAKRYGDYRNLADLANILVEQHSESPVHRATRQLRNLIGGDELPPLNDL